MSERASKRGKKEAPPTTAAASGSTSTVAVIMVGGPTKGTRFRPLSLHTPKPLFPVGGKPMITHLMNSCKKIPGLSSVFLVGFYEERDFALYAGQLSKELGVSVRYLRELKAHGSAGALYKFKPELLETNPAAIVILNCDVACAFPLAEMLAFHKGHKGLGTVLVKKVSAEKALQCGEVVMDPISKELLHYTERPEAVVSDLVNTGVYIFSPALLDHIGKAMSGENNDFVRLDQDILTPWAGKKQLYAFETTAFWEQVKTPGMALRASDQYLALYKQSEPELLATGPFIVGNVSIHTSAKVDPTAKLGPNVTVAPLARIGAGVRLSHCIVLDEVEVRDNACVSNCILGWKSVIGRWARVMGTGDDNSKIGGVTILGEDVTVADELVVVNAIVLPHKELKLSVKDEVIL